MFKLKELKLLHDILAVFCVLEVRRLLPVEDEKLLFSIRSKVTNKLLEDMTNERNK
ncbi:MAG: hypothetical protein IJN15_00720 [Clostridia bacterium]|nr:hypothetical protein [Clostridia bacterium]